MTVEEIESRLSVIRNDLALGRFDDRELNVLLRYLEMFNDYVKIHRMELVEGK